MRGCTEAGTKEGAKIFNLQRMPWSDVDPHGGREKRGQVVRGAGPERSTGMEWPVVVDELNVGDARVDQGRHARRMDASSLEESVAVRKVKVLLGVCLWRDDRDNDMATRQAPGRDKRTVVGGGGFQSNVSVLVQLSTGSRNESRVLAFALGAALV